MADIGEKIRAERLKARVTLVGAVLNVVLSVVKVVFGLIGHSAALIADGIHSLSDLASDLLVAAAIKFGAREADHDHPYGHRRYETMATVALGLGLVTIAGGIAWDVMGRVKHPERLLTPQLDTLGVAAASVFAKEWMYHYTKRVARKTRSKLLVANAWHHRSDAISSIVVLIGIGGVLLGYPFADAFAAVIVALMIAKIGLTLVIQSIKELVDTSLPEGFVNEIRRAIKTTPGVHGIHMLRTRQMGEDAYIDAHIVVDSRISVSEGHVIGDKVRHNLISEFDDVVDVLVHVDPEDDEFKEGPPDFLPRSEVQCYLREYLGELYEDVEEFKIHYLDGSVEVEVILSHLLAARPERVELLKRRCRVMENVLNNIAKVMVFLRV